MSNSPDQAIQIISSVPYFAGLDQTTLETVARVTVRYEYDRDQVIFIEGDFSTGLHIVESGWLKAVKISPDGREQVIHFLGPGEAFNALSVFTETPNPVTAIVLEPAVVWLVRRDMMLSLLESHPRLGRVIIEQLAKRIEYLASLVADISLRSVESRLARLLLQNAGDGTLHRQRWATQSEMASRLGTVPDVLNRTLRNLVSEELILVSRHKIEIIDRAGLEAKAQEA